MKRQQTFNIKGMTRDISPLKSNGEYAYDIKNMRLTAQKVKLHYPLSMKKAISNIL